MAELKTALETDNVEDIKAKTDALTQEFYKISQKLYENTGEAQGAEGSEGAKAEEDVVDADYEVVDEDEK